MSIAGDIAAYEAVCGPGNRPISQQIVIEFRDIREILVLAYVLSMSLSETAKEFSEAVDRSYSNMALEEAVSFRIQHEALMSLARIYEDETGEPASKQNAFQFLI